MKPGHQAPGGLPPEGRRLPIEPPRPDVLLCTDCAVLCEADRPCSCCWLALMQPEAGR